MTDAENRAQTRRERMTLHKASLGEPAVELRSVFGGEAISLVHRLTRGGPFVSKTLGSFSPAGQSRPTYMRAEIPCKFMPRAGSSTLVRGG